MERICDVCRMRPAFYLAGWCETCSALPRAQVYATTTHALNTPVTTPPDAPRRVSSWEPVHTTFIPATIRHLPFPIDVSERVCILWRCVVAKPEPTE